MTYSNALESVLEVTTPQRWKTSACYVSVKPTATNAMVRIFAKSGDSSNTAFKTDIVRVHWNESLQTERQLTKGCVLATLELMIEQHAEYTLHIIEQGNGQYVLSNGSTPLPVAKPLDGYDIAAFIEEAKRLAKLWAGDITGAATAEYTKQLKHLNASRR